MKTVTPPIHPRAPIRVKSQRLDRALHVWRVRRTDQNGEIRGVRFYVLGAAARYRARKWIAAGWGCEVHRSVGPVRFDSYGVEVDADPERGTC